MTTDSAGDVGGQPARSSGGLDPNPFQSPSPQTSGKERHEQPDRQSDAARPGWYRLHVCQKLLLVLAGFLLVPAGFFYVVAWYSYVPGGDQYDNMGFNIAQAFGGFCTFVSLVAAGLVLFRTKGRAGFWMVFLTALLPIVYATMVLFSALSAPKVF